MMKSDFSPSQDRDEAARWRTRGNDSVSDERWKSKEDSGDRWSRHDLDRGVRPPNTNMRTAGANMRSSSRERSPLRKREGRRAVRNDRLVYISNIPYDVRWMELKDLVREKAGEVNFVEILEDRNGKSKGSAVVEFREKESVQRCVDALHRSPMNDRLLTAKEIRDPMAFFRKVKEDTGVDFLNGLHGGKQRDARIRRDETFETYGLSPTFLRQLNIDGTLTNRVFVSNLPYNVQSGRLYDMFALAGKVNWVDLQLDKEGRSKGMAVIQFTHPIEAVQAISMLNNQRVFDRVINVKMDRFEPVEERREGELPLGLRSIGMGLGANGAPLGDVSSIISTLNSAIQSGNMEAANAYSLSQNAFQSGSGYTSGVLASTMGFNSGTYASGASTFAPSPGTAASFGTGGGAAFGNYSGSSYNASRSIIIKNLPLDYTWQIVRDRVQLFGPVEVTEMIAPGCAKVVFGSSSDAERARKALQNTTVEGRLIGVEYLA